MPETSSATVMQCPSYSVCSMSLASIRYTIASTSVAMPKYSP